MTWNLMSIVETGAQPGALYPSPVKSKVGIELLAGETVVASHDFGLMNVYRKASDGWREVYKSVGNKGELIITNQRVVILFEKVPTSRSMFTVIAVGQAIAGAGKHKGESFVGQMMYPWIAVVAARKRSMGVSNNTGMLRLIALDGTSPDQVGVMVEINKDKAPQIADQIVALIAKSRMQQPDFVNNSQHVAELNAATGTPFNPEPKTFQAKAMPGSVAVRG